MSSPRLRSMIREAGRFAAMRLRQRRQQRDKLMQAERARRVIEGLEQRLMLSGATEAAANDQAVEFFNASSAVFVQNQGQWADSSIKYAYNGSGINIGFTDTGPVMDLFKAQESDVTAPVEGEALPGLRDAEPPKMDSARIRLSFDEAAVVSPVGVDRSATSFNYLIGDANQHRSNVAGYTAVEYRGLWQGIDLKTWGKRNGLKYEFHVAPGADWRQIRVSYEGIEGLSIGADGSLHVATALGEIVEAAPVLYQEIEGRRSEVSSRFVRVDADTYGFEVTGEFDRSLELVIDPDLAWATYLGGSAHDNGMGIAVDGSGNAYVTGTTYSSGWATPGAYDTSHNGGNNDVFVAKLSATGSSLLYCTYLGGSGSEGGAGIALDGLGNAYVTGGTYSSGWATAGAYDTTHNGSADVFVARLNATGSSLLYCTYLGGSGDDSGADIAVDGSGNVYVTGYTRSSGWATAGAYDTTSNGGISDVFVARLNATGSSLLYCTYLGGINDDNGRGIAVDGSGNAYVTGETNSSGWATAGAYDTTHNRLYDIFVAKLSATGSSLLYCTYLGGSGDDYGYGGDDYGSGIAVDGSGDAYVTGHTYSSGWATAGAYDTTYFDHADVFVAKLNATGSSLLYCTYLGSNQGDAGTGIAVDGSGNAYVTGFTGSPYMATAGAYDTTHNGSADVFVAKMNATGSSLLYYTYLGGSGNDRGNGIAVDGAGNVYVTGYTYSSGWATSGAYDTLYSGDGDVFLAKFSGLAEPADAGDALALAHDLGSLASGSTASASDQVGNGSFGSKDVDLYRFALSSSAAVTLDVDAHSLASPLDGYLRLFSAEGTDLGFSDDVNGRDPLLTMSLSAGTYFVGVSGYPNHSYDPSVADSGVDGSTGAYTLRVVEGGTTSQPVPLAPGQSASPGSVIALASPVFSWLAPAGASEYGLYISKRQPDGTYALEFDSTTYGVTIPGSASTFTLPGGILEEGQQYRWNMNARIDGVWGPYTSRLYFRFSSVAAPASPGGLQANATGPETVELSWDAVAPGAVIYGLHRATSASGPWTNVVYSGSWTQWTDSETALAPDTTYYYAVLASNTGGDSPRSAAISVRTLAEIVVPAPTGLTATTRDSKSIALAWNAVPGASEYVVERSLSPSGGFAAIDTVAALEFVDFPPNPPTPGMLFVYRVRSMVNGRQSPPSQLAIAGLALTTREEPATPRDLPDLAPSPYDNIAEVFEWRWNDDAGATFEQQWAPLPRSDFGTLDWNNKQTIILTHGWNSNLEGSAFIGEFARDFMDGRENPATKYNILAIDWDAGSSEYDSDPDNVSNTLLQIGALKLATDARRSAQNGIRIARPLAHALVEAGLRPDRLALIGHSNGAGLMASLAKCSVDFLRQEGQSTKVKALFALDAPLETGAYKAVRDAAAAVDRTENHYLPLIQTSGDTPLLRIAIGFGAPMWSDRGIIANFESRVGYIPIFGHSTVPSRFARTAHAVTQADDNWGFRTSGFDAAVGAPLRTAGLWVEDADGQFKQHLANTAAWTAYILAIQGVADAVESYEYVVHTVLDTYILVLETVGEGLHEAYRFGVDGAIEIQKITVEAANVVTRTLRSAGNAIWDTTVTVAKNIKGANATLKGLASGDPLTWLEPALWIYAHVAPQNSAPSGDSAPRLGPASAEFDIHASVDVIVPSDATTLEFDLTVADPGNSDVLLVAVNGNILGEFSLASYADEPGSASIWVGDFASQSATLTFAVLSSVTTTADFTLGNLRFVTSALVSPGDANFDGRLDIDDYFLIDRGYALGLEGFANGDFNYDGAIDADDYFLLDQGFLAQPGPLASSDSPLLVPLLLGTAPDNDPVADFGTTPVEVF